METRPPEVAFVLLLALAAAAPATAQLRVAAPVESVQLQVLPAPEAPRALEFRMPAGDLRRPGDPRRSGLIAAYPVARNVEIGVGRFRVLEMGAPRTNMETERLPAAVRPRDRGVAAIGVSLRF